MEHGVFSGYQGNNAMTVKDCQFGGIIGYCVNLASQGNIALMMSNGACENVNLPSPYTGLGAFINLANGHDAEAIGGQMTMYCSFLPANAIVIARGQLDLRSVSIFCDGSAGAGAGIPFNLGRIMCSNGN